MELHFFTARLVLIDSHMLTWGHQRSTRMCLWRFAYHGDEIIRNGKNDFMEIAFASTDGLS